MPWDASPFAGFSTVEPWLPLNPDWPTRNVAAQESDPTSMLALTRALLTLRRAERALSVGGMELVQAPEGVLAYERVDGERRLLILLNLTSADIALDSQGTPLLSTLTGDPDPDTLRADEGLILA
jgi:oligo-1,6-glucosidase/alpha-glucosidase